MSLDGICIRAVVNHLQDEIVGGRIDRIHQPDQHHIILGIRLPKKNLRLLLSSHPQNARLHLTEIIQQNPPEPPMFCMVLRKHLAGGKLVDIHQLGLERIVHFTFQVIDEYGQPTTRILIGEFMGRHSNLILINPDNNLILDSLKRINHNINQYRELLPGIEYLDPPPQNKLDLNTVTKEQFIKQVLSNNLNRPVPRALLNILAGIGPQTALELTIRAGIDGNTSVEFLGQYDYDQLWHSITWLQDIIATKDFQPSFIQNIEHELMAFAPFPLMQFKPWPTTTFVNMSLLIEHTIGETERVNLCQQKNARLTKVITKEISKQTRRLTIQLDKITQGKKAEQFRIWGELLTANLYHLAQGP